MRPQSDKTFQYRKNPRGQYCSQTFLAVRGAALMQGKVEIAGVNTAKLKVLKGEETMELLRRTKEGDQGARRQLFGGTLGGSPDGVRTPTTSSRWAVWA